MIGVLWFYHSCNLISILVYKLKCRSLQFPEDKVFALAGFSEKVFDLMALLETDRLALVREIEKISL